MGVQMRGAQVKGYTVLVQGCLVAEGLGGTEAWGHPPPALPASPAPSQSGHAAALPSLPCAAPGIGVHRVRGAGPSDPTCPPPFPGGQGPARREAESLTLSLGQQGGVPPKTSAQPR